MRTVHHVDDFTTEALMECQRQAILEPDQIVVVSELWRKLLKADYGVDSHVVTNGVRTERFAALTTESTKAELRSRVCAGDRFLFLTVGGIEPRKGSEFLIDALAERKAKSEANGEAPPVLAVIGGHSFQDYRAYRERVLGSMEDKGLILDEDVFLLGTLDESEFAQWFHAADGFAFPSIKEGWGLVVLEAMAAGLPSVTSDIEVFHEFLVHGENAILTRAGDAPSLAAGLQLLQDDVALRERLATEGPRVAAKYSWARTARQHMHLYQMLHGV